MHNAQDDYLTTEVLTAIPQRLQLLLIEGALRFGNLARQHWQNQNLAKANDALIRCQHIVAEMIAGLNPDQDPKLVGQVVAVYAFIYTSLIAANLERSEAKLDEAMRVLEIERETWRLACEKAIGSRAPIPMPHIDAMSHDDAPRLGQSFVA